MSHETNHVQPSKSGHPIDINLEDALKAVGFTPTEIDEGAPDGVVIYKYSRADAMADGVLVDLLASPETASVVREAGFKLPIAMTSAAYEALIGTGELPSGQSVSGRLWDVLMVLRSMIRRLPDGADRVDFSVSVWDGNSLGDVACWCHCGPGDNGEPVLTLMLQGED